MSTQKVKIIRLPQKIKFINFEIDRPPEEHKWYLCLVLDDQRNGLRIRSGYYENGVFYDVDRDVAYGIGKVTHWADTDQIQIDPLRDEGKAYRRIMTAEPSRERGEICIGFVTRPVHCPNCGTWIMADEPGEIICQECQQPLRVSQSGRVFRETNAGYTKGERKRQSHRK